MNLNIKLLTAKKLVSKLPENCSKSKCINLNFLENESKFTLKLTIINSLFARVLSFNKKNISHYIMYSCDIAIPGPPRDCRVSEWGEWASCSRSCGIGETQRVRTVVKHARRGGTPCPPLKEAKWCGSARSCPKGYFNWWTRNLDLEHGLR